MKDAEYFVALRARASARSSIAGAQAEADPADQRRLRPSRHRGRASGQGAGRQQRRLESVAVAEHTLMLILAVYKKLGWHHHNVITGKWRVGDFSQTRMYELAGKTLGSWASGHRQKVAKRAQAFDMHVQYYDSSGSPSTPRRLGVRFVLFPELLRTSDVVTLHVPLTDATRGMMGRGSSPR